MILFGNSVPQTQTTLQKKTKNFFVVLQQSPVTESFAVC